MFSHSGSLMTSNRATENAGPEIAGLKNDGLHCVPKKTCDHIFDDKLK